MKSLMTRATRSQVAQAGAGPKVLWQPAQSTAKLQSQTKINISIVFIVFRGTSSTFRGTYHCQSLWLGTNGGGKRPRYCATTANLQNIKAVRLTWAATLTKLSTIYTYNTPSDWGGKFTARKHLYDSFSDDI